MAKVTKKARVTRARSHPRVLRQRSGPAKTTPPQLGPHYHRSRLYRLLDQAHRRPIVWISAPAGAGKTTLVRSFLQARELPCLWYQFDERDADPASFFSSLREAVRRLSPRKRETLQFLTPEYVLGLPVYTRNFFEQLAMRFATPFALVFDNYQDLPERAPLQRLLPQGLAALPEGFNVFILSRSALPAAFAGEQARRRIARVDGEALQLNDKEVRGIAKLYKLRPLSPQSLTDMQTRTQGWVAGVVLLLERLSLEAARAADVFAGGEEEIVFEYFATELFDKTDRRERNFLLKTALLPQVNAELARDITGERRSAEILAKLARKNFFTYRLAGPKPVYRYHPLFQSFLRARGSKDLTAEELGGTRMAAADALAKMGLYDDAATLLLEAADRKGLAKLVLQQAPVLATQGRLETLRQWLNALPQESIHTQPWLCYWLGMCRLPLDPPSARETLERAYELFGQLNDARGCYTALSGIIESFVLELTDLNPLSKWIEEFNRLDQTHPTSGLGDLEAPVVLAAMNALVHACPQHPRRRYWAERVDTLLQKRLPPEQQVPLAANLAIHRLLRGDFNEVQELGARLARLERDAALPITRIYIYGIRTVIAWTFGRLHEAEELVAAGLKEAETQGVHLLDARLLEQLCYACNSCGNVKAFERYFDQLAAIRQLSPFDRTQVAFFSSWLAFLHGDYVRARHEVEMAVAALEKLAFPWMLAQQRSFKAQVLTAIGDFKEAEQVNANISQFAEDIDSDSLRFQTQLTGAWIAQCRGDDSECLAGLAHALQLGRLRGFTICHIAPPKMMGELCSLALEHNLEVDYVRKLIRAHCLSPPASAIDPDAWPWPIRVNTLGRFAVVIDDKPLRFDKKAQKKPLELLKALIAFGGEDVSEQALIEALWFEAEGDAAAQALATTVHRLRRLLGADVLRRQEGRLSLDAGYCWVDTWALNGALARLEEASAAGELDGIGRRVEAVFRLYGGSFLERDPAAFWMLAPRERLRAKLLRVLVGTGQVLCQNGHRSRAVACYEKALEVEPLAEECYREIMRNYLAEGRQAEALRAYERCQKLLAAELGLSPSPETEALYQEIQKN